MLFADDFVLRSESREEVKTSLEKYGQALESTGKKIGKSKTKHMFLNEKTCGQIRLQRVQIGIWWKIFNIYESNRDCNR